MPGPLAPSSGYANQLADLKARIRQARLRVAFTVNSELIAFYSYIGRDILELQARDGWRAKVVDRLARDLRVEFLDVRGFSSANLRYMRAFAVGLAEPGNSPTGRWQIATGPKH